MNGFRKECIRTFKATIIFPFLIWLAVLGCGMYYFLHPFKVLHKLYFKSFQHLIHMIHDTVLPIAELLIRGIIIFLGFCSLAIIATIVSSPRMLKF